MTTILTKRTRTQKKKGRPRKGQESKKETSDVTGVASRTKSKSPIPDSTALPERRILKKRSQSA